jgi:hypothetical protein
MFCADLFVMTPEGAILARPASTVRAGEERAVARRLADLGVPILKTLTGRAVFEGADLMWLDPATAIIARGLRTNQAAIDQIGGLLGEIGASLLAVDLPYGTMHLILAAAHAPCRRRRPARARLRGRLPARSGGGGAQPGAQLRHPGPAQDPHGRGQPGDPGLL